MPNKNEKTTTELYEFLQENMATKEELNSVKENMATREELNFIKDNMVTKEEFDGLERKVGALDEKVGELDKKVEGLDKKVGKLGIDLRDHIDEKLSDLQGNIVVLMRKEDAKVLHLIKILKDKNILEDKDVRELLKMEPFPKPV